MKTKTPINFYCVGAQKAGTTTLHDILDQHPDVYLPKSKEAHFFDKDENFQRGVSWYEKTFFSDYNNQKIVGSCNPEYLYFEDVPKRIYETYGKDIKLVFILRNPVDRAYSHYLMSKRRCIEELSFEDGIAAEQNRIKESYFNKSHFSYLSRGYYSQQINRYLKYFSITNMFFIRFEDDFVNNRQETIMRLGEFLGINTSDLQIDIRSNIAKSARSKSVQKFIYKENKVKTLFSLFVSQKLKANIRKILYSLFMRPEKSSYLNNELREHLLFNYQDDILELEKLTRLDLKNWKK